jgi:hypothetical protein
MCCFSRPVDRVAETNIFARRSRKGHQFIVYSMTLETSADVAMILPLPVPHRSGEKSVTFINLEEYGSFFTDARGGFPSPKNAAKGAGRGRPSQGVDRLLEVVSVGSFEASFVPTVADFTRLDERFRLPDGTFEKLPGYKDWGFAVFKLKKGKKKIHPMAFEMPTRWPKKLFFPTVHIHDGKVHSKAKFDHSLYAQVAVDEDKGVARWTESRHLASRFMQVKKAKGLVSATDHFYWKRVFGERKNTDITV